MSFNWIFNEADKTKLASILANINSQYPFLESVTSPIFIDKNKFQWQLKIGKGDQCIKLTIYLLEDIQLDSCFVDYEVKFDIGIYYKDKRSLYVRDLRRSYGIDLNAFTMLTVVLSKPITFTVKINVLDSVNNILPILQEIPDFERLLNDEKFSDFDLICFGKEFHVHKNILAARSEVFSTMFELDMKERNEGKVIIEDFTPEVVQELLRFIYCGKVENLETFSEDLLRAAEKYLIEGLSVMCLESICKSINTFNALRFLSIACTYNADTVKSKIINFIVYNIKAVRQEPLFKTLTDPSVLKEILDKTLEVWL